MPTILGRFNGSMVVRKYGFTINNNKTLICFSQKLVSYNEIDWEFEICGCVFNIGYWKNIRRNFGL